MRNVQRLLELYHPEYTWRTQYCDGEAMRVYCSRNASSVSVRVSAAALRDNTSVVKAMADDMIVMLQLETLYRKSAAREGESVKHLQ